MSSNVLFSLDTGLVLTLFGNMTYSIKWKKILFGCIDSSIKKLN